MRITIAMVYIHIYIYIKISFFLYLFIYLLYMYIVCMCVVSTLPPPKMHFCAVTTPITGISVWIYGRFTAVEAEEHCIW